jgi:hypothetical protein
MRDGEDLARRLGDILDNENAEVQADLLSRVVRPYVQVVETDAVCSQTGLRLNDIWRYLRHTWVTSYKSVPGRSMMILVRDAAADNHPVIGIASLASSVVQQSTRDKWIGWDSETVVQRFRAAPKAKKCVQWLISELDGFIRGVCVANIGSRGGEGVNLERRSARPISNTRQKWRSKNYGWVRSRISAEFLLGEQSSPRRGRAAQLGRSSGLLPAVAMVEAADPWE